MAVSRNMFILILIASATLNLISCVNGQNPGIRVRLVGGPFAHAGRVEFSFYGSVWGTVCDDSWDINDAHVICRMLSYHGATAAYGSAAYGQGTGKPIFLDDVRCSGTETSIKNCNHGGWGKHNCGHSEDASVVCMPKVPNIRLVNGPNSHSGRVEVLHNSRWGTVCDDNWDLKDGNTTCKSLGYLRATAVQKFGAGTGPIWLDEVGCTVRDTDLINQCFHRGWGIQDCTHSEDAGVVCDPKVVGVRLAGGSDNTNGRVELNYNNNWWTVCDDNWDINDAKVICRMLGFRGASRAYLSAHFGQGSGSIALDDVECKGRELSITLCRSRGWGVHNCSPSEHAGVACIR